MNRKPSIVIIILSAVLTIGGVSAFRIAKHHRHAHPHAHGGWHQHNRCHAASAEQNVTNPSNQGTCHTKP